MRAEGGKKGKGKRTEKRRKKEEKMGIKIVFFFFVSRLSRSYPLLFAIKNYGESIWRLARAKYAPHPYFWQLFQISLAVLRIYAKSSGGSRGDSGA